MKLHQIRDFIAVAERGSVRAAARYLGVPQPSVTRSISELERNLGVVLFERRANGMLLTPIGEKFARRANAIQLELQSAKDEVEHFKGGERGDIAFGLAPAPHIGLLPKVMQPFFSRFPETQLEIYEGLFPALESGLREGKIEFYIGPLVEDSLARELLVERLYGQERVIFCRRGHPLADARSLNELADARWAAISASISRQIDLASFFEARSMAPPIITVRAHYTLSLLMIVASTDLLAMLPKQWLFFAEDLQLLQQIKVAEVLPSPEICLVRNARTAHKPSTEYLCDLFRRAAGNLNRWAIPL